MTAKEFVLSRYSGAVIEVDQTRERSKTYRVAEPSLSLPSLSVSRFSEEDAWQDAMERLSGRRPR